MSINLENVVLASPEQMAFIIQGMRNPMNSWEKKDSREGCEQGLCWKTCNFSPHWCGNTPKYVVGEADHSLMQRLSNAGTEHRKYLRMMPVYVRITAPLYWWKEFDTYKVGTVANSTSTMHKLATTPITLDCFEIDDYDRNLSLADNPKDDDGLDNISTFEEDIIYVLENIRQKYLETKDKRYWKELVRWLPESWLQKRTITMNYENVRNMYFQRRNHKLTEWSESFIKWVESLPYAEELIMYDGKSENP